jgi:hypothetical protein
MEGSLQRFEPGEQGPRQSIEVNRTSFEKF